MPAIGSGNKPASMGAKKKKTTRPAPVRQPGPISDAENRKVTRHKRTRSYYKAYEAGWQANPKVEKAYKATANPKTRKRGLRSLERERRRGPDKVAKPAYRYYVRHLWDRVKDEYPNPKDRPKIKLDSKMPSGLEIAYVRKGENVVHYGSPVFRGFMGPGTYEGKSAPNPARGRAKTVPLHEWTHTRQSSFTNKAKTEGGAQANEKRLAKKLKMPYFKSSAEYERWAARMRRKYGEDWVAHGQYEGGK